jgi:hypothetical protein
MDNDLSDFGKVPRLPEMHPVRKYVVLVLWQAQQDHATQVMIGQPVEGNGVPVRYQVEGTWYDYEPFPEHIRREVVATILSMAGRSDPARFPVEGEIDERLTAEVHLQWHASVAALDAPIRLYRWSHE